MLKDSVFLLPAPWSFPVNGFHQWYKNVILVPFSMYAFQLAGRKTWKEKGLL